MWDKLIAFIIRYEYARALFDKRAANRFSEDAHDLFKALAGIEINHAVRLEKILENRVLPLRSMFFEENDYAIYNSVYLDGISKRHIWTKFLFNGKAPSEYGLLDTLAFCAAAERLENIGYRLLSLISVYRELATSIALEESNAEERILELLFKNTTRSAFETRLLICHWYAKAFISMFILVFTGNR